VALQIGRGRKDMANRGWGRLLGGGGGFGVVYGDYSLGTWL